MSEHQWKQYSSSINVQPCKQKHYHKKKWVPQWLFNFFAVRDFFEHLEEKYKRAEQDLKEKIKDQLYPSNSPPFKR